MFYYNFKKQIFNGQISRKKKKKVGKTKIAKSFQLQYINQIDQISFTITNLRKISQQMFSYPKKQYAVDLFAVCNFNKQFIYTLTDFSNGIYNSQVLRATKIK